MTTHPYQYVTLRVVPRVEREEFLNVGVVVHCQDVDLLRIAYRLDARRLQAVHRGVDLAALDTALRNLARICAGGPGSGLPENVRLGARFGWIAAPRSTVVQPGPRHGGVTSDPDGLAEALLGRLVGD